MVKVKPHPITDAKCQLPMLVIIIMLCPLLRLMEMLTNLMNEVGVILKGGAHSCHLGLARNIVTKTWRWPTIDNLEWSGTKSRVVGRVVAEFRPGQPFDPAAWPVNNEATQVHCDDFVDNLGQTIRLG